MFEIPDLRATCERCDEGTVPPPIALDPEASNLCMECSCEIAVELTERFSVRLEDQVQAAGKAMQRLGHSMEALNQEDDSDG